MRILQYATRQVGPDNADDIVNAVFTVAWRHSERIHSDPLPWLYTVARYEVAHLRRRQARTQRLHTRLAGLAETSRPIEEHHHDLVALADLREVLAQLAERDAEILTLTAWEGLTPAQIAQVLQCSTAAVRSRLHRGRRRAQALLADLNPTPTAQPHLLKETWS